jgi:basic membrane protein A
VVFGIGFLFSDDVLAGGEGLPGEEVRLRRHERPRGRRAAAERGRAQVQGGGGQLPGRRARRLLSKTHKLGFVGGMQIPLIKKFEAGYVAGVKKVAPATTVDVKYAGVDGSAFKNPTKGKELALAIYNGGADIIYHASGSTGLGVFEAAREKDKLAIGVDSDQQSAMPGHVLTSMVKRVDVAVFNTIKDVQRRHLPRRPDARLRPQGRRRRLRLRRQEQGDDPDDVHQKVEALRREIDPARSVPRVARPRPFTPPLSPRPVEAASQVVRRPGRQRRRAISRRSRLDPRLVGENGAGKTR